MFSYEFKNNSVYIIGTENFSLSKTLDCGQAFRWEKTENGCWQGVAFDKFLKIQKTDDNRIVLLNTSKEDFQNIWIEYFDLNRDYNKIIETVSCNNTLKNACEYGNGIRVLNQEPWETLFSFIISQNNNIKRIKGIISRLCENFGEKKEGYYTFPKPEKIATLTIEDLSVLRSGFRAKYILDASKKVSDGEVKLNLLKNMPIEDARNELMKIKGVGPKVADCALLFSHKHIDAFPKDVWIKRAMEKLFGGELPKEAIEYAGIIQQYIFFYARETKLDI